MITEIQRKEVDVIESSLGSYLDISDDDNGMFVLYDDHKVFVAELGKKVTKFESSEGCDSNYQRKRHTELKKVARDLRESNTELEKRVKELEDLCKDMGDFMATSIDCLYQANYTKGVAEIMIKRVNEKKLAQRMEALMDAELKEAKGGES